MKNYFDVYKKSKLFEGIKEEDFDAVFKCLSANFKSFKKGEIVIVKGDEVRELGMILCGSVIVSKDDYWGSRAILSKLSTGKIFEEAFALSENAKSGVTVTAETECTILFLDIRKIMTVCSSACSFHSLIMHNFVKILASKNVLLTEKMELLSKKTTREKLLTYLSECSQNCGSSEFSIPYNREQLADFLCVDRSAMSKELSKLRDEGILEYNKEHFILK